MDIKEIKLNDKVVCKYTIYEESKDKVFIDCEMNEETEYLFVQLIEKLENKKFTGHLNVKL